MKITYLEPEKRWKEQGLHFDICSHFSDTRDELEIHLPKLSETTWPITLSQIAVAETKLQYKLYSAITVDQKTQATILTLTWQTPYYNYEIAKENNPCHTTLNTS